MTEVSADRLRETVEELHGCKATFREIVPVRVRFHGQNVWDGIVHVFDVDLDESDTCFAWSHETWPDKRRFYAVIKTGPVTDPQSAVATSIVADNR